MDFTLEVFKKLSGALNKNGFSFKPSGDFNSNPGTKVVIMRHDVDSLPENSLQFAKIEKEEGICGTYYFRIVAGSYNEEIIKKIYSLGHEIGYHYEDVSIEAKRQKALGRVLKEEEVINFALQNFRENLAIIREIAPVKSICMHGSPMSKWDSRLLWRYYDYKEFGITGEPYFDVNFERMLYLTDTGRSWDGRTVSVRDKADGRWQGAQGEEKHKDWKVKPIPGSLMNMTKESTDFHNMYKFRSTYDIIRAAENGELPDKIMMTFHPQRWTDKAGPWIKEFLWQNVKNVGKYFLIKIRD
jgi:hypothetical protein